MVDAELAWNVAVIGDVQDQQVGLFADFQAAGDVSAAYGVRGVDRSGAPCLFRRQPQPGDRQREGHLHTETARCRRLISARKSHGRACIDKLTTGCADGTLKELLAGRQDRNSGRVPQRRRR